MDFSDDADLVAVCAGVVGCVVAGVVGALMHGATCGCQPGQVPEPAVIARLIAEHGVDTVHVSASLLNFLVDEYPGVFAACGRS